MSFLTYLPPATGTGSALAAFEIRFPVWRQTQLRTAPLSLSLALTHINGSVRAEIGGGRGDVSCIHLVIFDLPPPSANR